MANIRTFADLERESSGRPNAKPLPNPWGAGSSLSNTATPSAREQTFDPSLADFEYERGIAFLPPFSLSHSFYFLLRRPFCVHHFSLFLQSGQATTVCQDCGHRWQRAGCRCAIRPGTFGLLAAHVLLLMVCVVQQALPQLRLILN